MSEQPLMKDGLSKAAIKRISRALEQSLPNFEAKKFERDANKGLESLELKERVQHIIEAMHKYLPQPYPKAQKILAKVPGVWDVGAEGDSLSVFAAWPIIDYSSTYGLDYPEKALKLLPKLTHLFSSEFAVRPFISHNPEAALSAMAEWAESKNEHIRRLASEGCRPRLPWGMQLKNYIQDPSPIIPILERLKADPSLYVRRSVANNINDISKDHPDIVLKLCQKWKKINNPDIDWVIKHALRTLIKKGDSRVFPLLGFETSPDITIERFKITRNKIQIGEELEFECHLKAKKRNQKIVLDYAIHYVKANGSLSAKVFKLRELNLKKNEEIVIHKKHSFKLISTRKFHPGKHSIALHVNGKEITKDVFELKS